MKKEIAERALVPKKILEYYGRVYSSAWKQADDFRSVRGREIPFFPDWCFLPLSGAYAIVSDEARRQGAIGTDGIIRDPILANDIGVLGALIPWRVTQGVYRFDPDVYAAVIGTPVAGDLPSDLFYNLPEWCVYIDTPGLAYLGTPVSGCFCHLEYAVKSQGRELRLAFVVENEPGAEVATPYLIPVSLHLGDWSLQEALRQAVEEAKRNAAANGGHLSPTETELSTMAGGLQAAVSLVIYICSVGSDIGTEQEKPARPRPKKTKKGRRFFPPQEVKPWDVGVRMGAALRKMQASAADDTGEETAREEKGTERRSPRPHIRRAHWHGYWSGSGRTEYAVKWIPPVLVMGDGAELPVKITPVK